MVASARWQERNADALDEFRDRRQAALHAAAVLS
jgi:hypothetical protein